MTGDALTRAVGDIKVRGANGGYDIHLGPWAVLLMLFVALGLGIWNTYELRLIRQDLGRIMRQQSSFATELGTPNLIPEEHR